MQRVVAALSNKFAWILAVCLISLTVGLPVSTSAADTGNREQVFQAKVLPFLKNHCINCHGGKHPESELGLDTFKHASAIATTGRKQWQKVLSKLQAREMPPPDETQPSLKEVDSISEWIEAALSDFDCTGAPDPGYVMIRRLNRVEYRNTIRDLFGIDYPQADKFPAGEIGYALSLMEMHLDAAAQIAKQATTIKDGKPSAAYRRIFIAQPSHKLPWRGAARKILRPFVSRAYRRPVTKQELDRLIELVARVREGGGNFEESIQLAIQVTLVSPNFLFKVEQDPHPNDPKTVRFLHEYELAARLSYFLWSTIPDDELLKQAKQGTLRGNLEAQVVRMLKDPKSKALVKSFAGQWLQLDKFTVIIPDKNRYPEFDDELRAAARTETEQFFQAIMREDRSVLELIDADFTFANERLARHYGISGVTGKEFQRVSLSGTLRGGVMTMASVLILTSNPDRTSPVKRGEWILTNILGAPPPSPPAGVPELAVGEQADLTGSLRKRMEQHRENPRCAACHLQMDALGFAFENFDGIGAWRAQDGKFPIDPSGVLPGGLAFKGPAELKILLQTSRKNDFVRCLTKKMLSYAVGREMEYYDQCTVDQITNALAQGNYKFSTLITQIVHSDPFQKRRGKKEED